MRGPSLKRPLIVYPLVVHLLTLLVSVLILIAGALRIDSGGPYTDERIVPIIAAAIDRDPSGALVIRPTDDLSTLQAETPNLWFMVEDDAGNGVTFGTVPALFESFRGRLSELSFAQLRDRTPPHDLAAVLRRETTQIGPLTVLGHGALSELNLVVLLASSVIVVPIILLLSITSFAITPWIVRRALAGMSRIAREAEEIDPDRRGRRLSEAHVPREIAPLVRAMNDALRRLDEGHERQQRFIASASHELRTPIAVLQSKVDSSADPVVRALGGDLQRLTILTEQLLDLQRLAQGGTATEVDLVALARSVVADLAPLAIAGGRSMEVQVLRREACLGDAAALERVLMNLLRNAIDHGGRHVVLRVIGRTLEVQDDGPGIPPDQRERVFEPFYRLRPHSTGSGLGLNLVAEVVARHNGRVTIHSAPDGGTIVQVDLGVPAQGMSGMTAPDAPGRG
ncbi:sensor histidine kinase [Paracoccus gahaiensis]|nr:HAMP domain-containing sensor histidine kinase [Paracoccus gahaiensis]